MKNLLLPCLIIISSITGAFSQKAAPLKFDEFSLDETEVYWPYTASETGKRIDRFISKAKSSPRSRFYIVSYSRRQFTESSRRKLGNWIYQTKTSLAYNAKIPGQNIIVIDGGFRDADMLEFWLGSLDSSLPVSTPIYSQAESFECPEAFISDDGMNLDEKSPVAFRVYTSYKPSLTYKWSTEQGVVVEGQNTKSAKIDTKGRKRLTIYVELAGAPKGCNIVLNGTFEVGPRPYLSDRADIYNSSELAARFQAFAVTVQNNPMMDAYVFAYASRRDAQSQRNRALLSLRRIIAFLKLDTNRIKIVDAGVRESDSVEFWLVPPGVDPPKATPTVDQSLVKSAKSSNQTKRGK